MKAQTSSADMDNGSTLEQGLIGHWTFDGKDTPWSSATAGTAIDRSGNGNNGTLTNMTRAGSPTIGKLGQALNFNGINDYVDAAHHRFSLEIDPFTYQWHGSKAPWPPDLPDAAIVNHEYCLLVE